MSVEVTVSLPEALYEEARGWAALTQQDLPDAITYALTLGLNRARTFARVETPVSSLSDDDVLALSRAQKRSREGQRLTRLLENQRQGLLTESEIPILQALLQAYGDRWPRHAEALTEAIRRGLRPPLDQ